MIFKTWQDNRRRSRRLSLHLDGPIDERVVASILLSQVRMLARFGTSAHLPPFLLFKHLQVLTIEIERSQSSTFFDFTGICHFFRLRFVKIKTYNGPIKLPRKIGGLHQLETFHVQTIVTSSWSKNPPLRELPTDIVHMNQLLHLILPYRTRLPDGIEGMKSLRTLHSFYIGLNSTENIEGLGELTNLTDVKITDHRNNVGEVVERAGRGVLLMSCLEKLFNLKYLSMHFYTIDAHVDALSSVPASFCHLQRFHGSRFSTVPGWIGRLSSLYDLELGVKEVLEDDVEMLAQLPSLIHLSLCILGASKDKILIRGGSGFPVLKHFKVVCSRISCLTFGSRAMPKLERLKLGFNARGWDRNGAAPGGIEHLSSLKGIYVNIGGQGIQQKVVLLPPSSFCWVFDCCTDADDEPEPEEEL